ncbi:hypothetical protein [Geofilum rubicundum]|uniref:Uncharacterized protein n=1 Tax=Geofilum rubicundum JCM 15548 TaxID=1236989 RepID=A0A0E9M2W7_9BACT|nr:hypothetical protein [Geofilum rubicundum]GAO31490.1 hypothetical protein JCM15548_13855 [Geofilum rubicundum JCM 15548]
MKSYNQRYISRADFHALQSLRIPYTGFVKGVGYAYTSFGFIPPAHQHRVSAPTRVPYNQSYQQTTITQLVDTSPEAQVRSLHLQPDDLIQLLVTKRPGGGHNLNLGNGRIEQLSADCQIIREITDTPTGMKYKIGYINKATGQEETTSGYLRDMHITFTNTTNQIAPLEIPGEINLTASQVLMQLPTQEKQARQQTSWQYYGWIFTDPNGTAPMDATPFRAHKTYILSDALSWISLIGSMSRPRSNNRSTNFWAWFGQCLEKLGDMGNASAPREAYSNESQAPTYNRPDSIATPWIRPNGDINYFKGKVGEYPTIRSQITEKEFEEIPKSKSTKFKDIRFW